MEIKKLVKNISWLSLGELVSKLAMFAATIVIARLVGVEAFGVYSAIFAFVGICSVVADFGSSGIFLREATQNTERLRALFWHFLAIKAGFTALYFLTIAVLLVATTFGGQYPQLIALYSIYVGLDTVALFLLVVFRAKQRFVYEAAMKIVTRTAFLVALGVVWSMHIQLTLQHVYSIFVVVSIVSVTVVASIVWGALQREKAAGSTWQWNRTLLRAYALESVLLGISSLLWQLYYRIDQVMVFHMRGPVEAGLYGSATTLYQTLNTVPALVVTGLYPTLSQLYTTHAERFRRVVRTSAGMGLALGAVAMVCGIALAPYVIQWGYGSEYAGAAITLQLLCIPLTFVFVTHLMMNMLVVAKHTGKVTIVSMIGAVVNIGLNYLLIPKTGYNGAAIATVITEAVVCTVVCVLYGMIMMKRNYEHVSTPEARA